MGYLLAVIPQGPRPRNMLGTWPLGPPYWSLQTGYKDHSCRTRRGLVKLPVLHSIKSGLPELIYDLTLYTPTQNRVGVSTPYDLANFLICVRAVPPEP